MTENEMKTRKQWLGLLIVSLILNMCYLAINMLNNPGFTALPSWVPYAQLAWCAGFSLGFGYLFYHCAYRKPGTKLLTFMLIFVPITTIAGVAAFVSGKVAMPSGGWFWGYMSMTNVLGVWGYILNWKMRKINQKLKLA